MSVFDKIQSSIQEYSAGNHEVHPFYHFEPWDVAKRPPWVGEMALKDGINLYSPGFITHVGVDPHPFQTGYLMSDAFFRSICAGTSVGKSYVALVEALIMLTGETPISLRFPEGQDTKVKRLITSENIRRWGRHDSKTGELIDYDDSAAIPSGWNEWDCGSIIGVGVYPPRKLAPPGGEVWLGTYMKAMNEYWWPKLDVLDSHCLIPPHIIDTKRGMDGYSRQDKILYLTRGGKIAVITYESGFNRFEAQRVWAVVLDEEPDDERIVQAAQQHAEWFSIIETPYRGITYTKELIFPLKPSPEKRTFHACQYDSPYQTRAKIEIRRENMKPWEVGARIWGFHSEMTGRPYYDRNKIMSWIQRWGCRKNYKWAQFVPKSEFLGIRHDEILNRDRPALEKVGINMTEPDADNMKDCWRIYEDRQDDVPYVMSVDPAEGAEEPSAAGDYCAAMIARPGEGRPKIVATLRSTQETVPFAWTCAYAAFYYNGALLAAETRRAACNAAFAVVLGDYPYWYRMTTIQESTNRPRSLKGFDPNASTRSALFDLIGGWLSDYTPDEYPEIPDENLLTELGACIVGKNGRPDHTSDGSLDLTICMGIILYVLKYTPEQVVCNISSEKKAKPFGKLLRRMGIDGDCDNSKKPLAIPNFTWRGGNEQTQACG